MRRPLTASLTILLLLTFALSAFSALASDYRLPPAGYRPFIESSYWNTPLPHDAPVDADSDAMIRFLKRSNTFDHIRMMGLGSKGGAWGRPIYWADASDPTYNVRSTKWSVPAEFSSLRIPRGAQPDIDATTNSPTGDAAMTVYDLDKGYVAGLLDARFDETSNTWTVQGGSIHYLSSNGLDRRWARLLPDLEGMDNRNEGHRGVPASAMAIRFDEIAQGAIDRVLSMFVNETRRKTAVFPMIGGEDNRSSSDDPYAPPEGTRIRIKPSVDLDALSLSRAERVIAEALQRYGAVISDMDNGPASIKVEHTLAEGRGNLWDGVLTADALSSIPLDMFEVVKLGYVPPASPIPTPSPSPSPSVSPSPSPSSSPSPSPPPVDVSTRTISMFKPVDDSFVTEARPHVHRGRKELLRTRGGPRKESLVKFDVSGTSGEVLRATLRVHVNRGRSGLRVYSATTNKWSETRVDWKNRPRREAFLDEVTRMKNGWARLDVTSAIVKNGTHTFVIATRSSVRRESLLASKESKGAWRAPKLKIVTES